MSDEDWNKVETETWTPENEGDEIFGIYIGVEHDVGENDSNIYTFEVTEGKNVGVWGSTVLDRKMNAVKVGHQVKIVYLGKVTPQGGREYKNYDVFFKTVPLTESTPDFE